MLGVTYNSAWFIIHRIIHAIEQKHINKLNRNVEVVETYFGGKYGRIRKLTCCEVKTPVISSSKGI